MLTKAIVRKPSKSIINGIASAKLGVPNYELALRQHEKYIEALVSCDLKVTILPPDEDYPDSTFVEDTAILTDRCAIITNPGAPSRRGETHYIKSSLNKIYTNIEEIKFPATLDGGDVLRIDDQFYIGLSTRTNEDGAAQLITILNKYGYDGTPLLIHDILHLKTAVGYLGRNNLIASGELITAEEFKDYKIIKIDKDESYAANCLNINDKILIPSGYPTTKELIKSAGYTVLELDVSEFRKLDGGLSCLSLRF